MERLCYIDEGHKYFGLDSGLEYSPVSTVAKILEPKVDWEEKKANKAAKLGITPEELQEEWDRKKLLGTSAGTWVHNLFEEATFKTGIYIFEHEGQEQVLNVVKYEMDGDRKLQIANIEPGKCYPELIVGICKDHVRIGGQSDKVLVDRNGYVHILDFKTDKAIEFQSFRSWQTGYQMFEKPCGEIMACNYNMYSIKMSMYMYFILAEHPELKPGTITIQHRPILRDENGVPIFDQNGDPTLVPERYRDFEVNYRYWQPVVRKVLNHYYQTTK